MFVIFKKVFSFASAYGERHDHRNFGMIISLSVSSILAFLQEFNLRYWLRLYWLFWVNKFIENIEIDSVIRVELPR